MDKLQRELIMLKKEIEERVIGNSKRHVNSQSEKSNIAAGAESCGSSISGENHFKDLEV
jgi:hypothetical protein